MEIFSFIIFITGGHLLVKILKRTAQFTAQSGGTGMVPPQQIKMLVPKKTKLFMEQTLRERENAVGKSRIISWEWQIYLFFQQAVFTSQPKIKS
jgi:Bardet-Biedl syndrome 1 protein